jgi:hypothetical protein
MRRFRAASLVLAALAAGLLLAACGSSGKGELLPGATADRITSNLDLVRESAENGDCEKAEDTVAEVSDEVNELPKINAQLKSALEHGAEKLSEVVSTCGLAEEEAEEERLAEEEAEEQEQLEAQEELAEEEAFKEEQKEEEKEEKAKEKAEKEAEQPEPPTGGEESEGNGKAKGHEKQEEIETPGEEEVTPPGKGGGAGGIGPGASVEGSG